MKNNRILFLCLIVFSFSISGFSNEPKSSQEQEVPEQYVDLGIRVVSNTAEDGTVTTVAIGRADNPVFMKDNPTAKPLYFATGNLIVHKDGSARIGEPGEIAEATSNATHNANDRERDLFSWANTANWSTTKGAAKNSAEEVAKNAPTHISGNPTYDIARAKLGAGWRLPTAQELSFLIDSLDKGITLEDDSHGWHSIWDDSLSGIILTSSIAGFTTQSLFLPAVGFTTNSLFPPGTEFYQKHGYVARGKFGLYWSGTRYDFGDTEAYRLYFRSSYCGVGYYCGRNLECSVRPVSE